MITRPPIFEANELVPVFDIAGFDAAGFYPGPACEIAGFDLWMTPYAGADNPGPDFVRGEMQRVGYRGKLELISGGQSRNRPRYFGERPGLLIEVVNVVGDHTDEGAWADLTNITGIIASGGYLIFDALIHPSHTLLGVWRRFQETYAAEFEFCENLTSHNGTGVARRRD